jgi:hypothetical protein
MPLSLRAFFPQKGIGWIALPVLATIKSTLRNGRSFAQDPMATARGEIE